MILLVYLLSLAIFFITSLLGSMIIRTVYLIIFKRQSFIYQFIGEFFGVMVGFHFGSLVFKWFDKQANFIILGLIYLVMWQISNMKILPQHYPKAQRIGVVTGILVIVIKNLLVSN